MVGPFAAKVTARTGKRPLTTAVPIRVILMLLIQRMTFEVFSLRRGERNSQIATTVKTPRKADSLINGSFAMIAK
jgi:hypothetical protein